MNVSLQLHKDLLDGLKCCITDIEKLIAEKGENITREDYMHTVSEFHAGWNSVFQIELRKLGYDSQDFVNAVVAKHLFLTRMAKERESGQAPETGQN